MKNKVVTFVLGSKIISLLTFVMDVSPITQVNCRHQNYKACPTQFPLQQNVFNGILLEFGLSHSQLIESFIVVKKDKVNVICSIIKG